LVGMDIDGVIPLIRRAAAGARAPAAARGCYYHHLPRWGSSTQVLRPRGVAARPRAVAAGIEPSCARCRIRWLRPVSAPQQQNRRPSPSPRSTMPSPAARGLSDPAAGAQQRDNEHPTHIRCGHEPLRLQRSAVLLCGVHMLACELVWQSGLSKNRYALCE
jgi:hypothetical protein